MKIHQNLRNTGEYKQLMRYMDLSKFVDFLLTGSFHFTRLSNFEDKSEAISQRQLVKYFKHDIELGVSTKRELKLIDRQERYFANCWFAGARESVGMWSIYSNRSSIALKLAFSDFMSFWNEKNFEVVANEDWIDNIYIDKVYYKNYLSNEDVMRFKDETKIIGFQKDLSYEHEKEVRVLVKCCGILKKVPIKERNLQFFKIHPLNLKSVPIKLVFHPLMDSWEKSNIKKIIKKYGYNNIKTVDSEVSPLLKGLENK